MPRQSGFAPILVVLLLSAGMLGGGFFIYQKYSGSSSSDLIIIPSATPQQKACTLEAKLCPDGSSVGRSGPNCEFSSCPSQESTPSADVSTWKIYDNPQMGFTFMYPNNWDTKILPNPGPLTQPDELLIGTIGEIDRQNTPIKLFTYYNPDKLSVKEFNEKLGRNNQSGDPIGLWSDNQTIVKMSNGTQAYYQKEFYCVAMCQSYVWVYDKWIMQLVNYPKNISNQSKLFDQILSTFKFLP